jgi:hypothetical protein
MFRETISDVFQRKIDDAKCRVRDARTAKEKAVWEAEAKVQAEIARLDLLENLAELDWRLYAEITLTGK